MELEKGNDLPREVSRDQEDSATSKDMEMEATPPADEKKRGKRRSENGDHDHSKKRSKKKKKSKKDDDEHGAADHGAPDGGGDGEGDKRKGSERSSSNHHHGHRDHHHSRHHRDKDRSDKSSSSSSASSSVEAASRKSADREGDDQRHKKRRKQDHPDANHDDGHDGDGSRHGHRRHHDAGDGADHADDKKRSKDDRSRHGSREKDERERERERERGRSSSRPRDERRRADDDNDERSSSRHHRDRHHHRDRRDDGGDDDYYRRHHHQQQPRDRRDVERYEDRDHHRHTERHDDRESHRHHSRRADDASYERELREYRRRQQQQQQQQQPLDGEPSRSSARQRDEAPADSRRRGLSDYADRRDPDRRDNGGRGQDQQQQQQQQKQVVDEELARMVEEELRRKESEQTEEEKAQKLIEERRRKRQAILDKYKQQQPPQQQQDKAAAAADEAASSSTSTDAATAAPAAADENKKAEEAERLAAVAATDATTAATSTSTSTANASSTSEGEAKRTVTHFDMFNELPASLIPSDDKLGRPARAAAAAGEDELNLQDNWDDEEGYYAFRIGEMVKGRYAVHASHGKGVFSTVLIAKDTHKDDVEVAIKVIRNNDTMFRAGLKETELLEKITAADPKDKRHCIRVLDSFQYRNHLCIVLEPMSMNLREVVKKFGRDVGITMQAVRTYARQLFVALKHLKSLNVLHADLKPDNIVLNHNLTVLKLCDFGSASLMEEENAITPYLVSRFYRAPEIMLGLPYDFEIDVWAAGCCLFEMYTGRILFQGQSNNEMLRMQMEAMGPFGRKMLRRSKFWQRHFNQQTFYFQQVCIDEVSQQEYVKEVNVVKPTRDLRAELQRAASAEDESQAGQLADLVLKCLQLDPSKRISPELALAHPFLKAP